MALDDTTIIDDALSRVLRLAYLGAAQEDEHENNGHTTRTEMDEGLLRSYLFGSEAQYQRAVARCGANLTRWEKH